jgi:pyruvate decarboxylase
MVHPGEFDVYAEVAQKFACARADMACEDAGEAAHRFDEALIQCVQQSKPIYANLPSDMVSRNVPRDWLDKELETSLPVTSETEVDKVVDTILDRIRCARKPMIIADGLSYPWDLVDEANEIAQLTEMRTYCFNAGKGVVNEDLPSWIGPLSAPTSYTTSTDLALLFGPLLSGTNTAAYTVIPDPGISISFNLDHVKVGDEITNISAKEVLKRLIERLRRDAYIANTSFLSTLPKANIPAVSPTPPHTNSPITQDALWHRFSSWLKPHDTLLLANGTPLIGGRELSLPSPCQVIASGIWCSIGSMLPCAQGVAAAKRDHNLPGRTILFEGDGSFQVTAQAISDIIRYRLDVTIFICNNKGYTYERMLHGERAEYNDVPDWRYVDAAMFFGAGRRKNKNARYSMWARKVETWGQLEEVLENEKLANGKGLKIVDIVMDPLDVPSSSRAGLKRASEALKAL